MLDLDNINSSSVVEDNQIISSQPPISIAKDIFKHRHIGIDSNSQQLMLKQLGYNNLDTLINTAVPKSIRLQNPLKLPSPLTETQA